MYDLLGKIYDILDKSVSNHIGNEAPVLILLPGYIVKYGIFSLQ